MSFYLYRPDANNFAGIGFSLADDERIGDVHYTDTPLAEKWIAPVAHGFEDNPETEGDFPSLSNFWRIPVMSQRAWDTLLPLIGYCCEALPIIHPTGKHYSIIHVMDTVDCLDCTKSELTRNATTGRVNRIYRYAFKDEMLHAKHIFKLPLECGGELIVDDEFRKAVQANKLKGLQFKELPVVQ
jgi:hypothetical protein